MSTVIILPNCQFEERRRLRSTGYMRKGDRFVVILSNIECNELSLNVNVS